MSLRSFSVCNHFCVCISFCCIVAFSLLFSFFFFSNQFSQCIQNKIPAILIFFRYFQQLSYQMTRSKRFCSLFFDDATGIVFIFNHNLKMSTNNIVLWFLSTFSSVMLFNRKTKESILILKYISFDIQQLKVKKVSLLYI